MKSGSSKENPASFLNFEEGQLLIKLAEREGHEDFRGVWAKEYWDKEKLFCFVCGETFKKDTQCLWVKDYLGNVSENVPINIGTVEHGRSHVEKLMAFL